MPIRLLIAQAPLHCLPLRLVRFPFGEDHLRLGRRQLRPLQRIEGVVWKENLSNEWAGEEGVRTLERIQDKACAVSLSTGEFLLANRDDRFDFRSDLSVRSDSDSSALHIIHVSLDLALVGLEPDVL